KMTLTKTGVTSIRNLNPYELQQAETMASSGGISYEDFTNITKNTRVSTLGNDASQNLQVKLAAGSWTLLRHVNFGTEGAAKFMLRAKGEGTVELRLSRKGVKAAATVNVSSSDMQDYTIEVDASKFKGVKTVYLVASAATDLYVDAWQFTDSQATGISAAKNNAPVTKQLFDLSGRRLSSAGQHRGIVIEQYTDENGVTRVRKRK
ncbi:MAG: carbohydrate-binding protein, partial [Prevotella sp.]|nr:carbohydrate-binding protein [Prevotella sp.]